MNASRAPQALLNRLADGQCIAFVGAGFSAPLGLPNWGGLLNSLLNYCENLRRDGKDIFPALREGIDDEEYLLVASVIRKVVHPSDILSHFQDIFGDHIIHKCSAESRAIIESRLKNILAVPWRGIITTNFDNVVEYGLNQSQRPITSVVTATNEILGTLLSRTEERRMFFLKLHGSLSTGRIVLSSEEYNECYLKSPRVSRFLNAIMMSYHIVFIGCSLDDYVVDIRRQLTAEFDGHIPVSYAILPDSRRNRRRLDWLRENCRIDVLLYPENDHGFVDRYLENFSQYCDMRNAERAAGETLSRNIRKQRIDVKWNEIGEINRSLILYVKSRGGSIQHIELLQLPKTGEGFNALSIVSASERIYRMFFLVHCSLIVESRSGDQKVYMLSSDMQDFLDSRRRDRGTPTY